MQYYTYTDVGELRDYNYYKLKQVDFDGKFTHSRIINVSSDKDDKDIELIKTINVTGQEVNEYYVGVVYYVYSDGSVIKKYQNR
jgi:hypothetical protein